MFLLDWYMGDQARDWFTVNQRIVTIPGNTGEYIFSRISPGGVIILFFNLGVLETGLFVNMAQKAYFGLEDGTVLEKSKPV